MYVKIKNSAIKASNALIKKSTRTIPYIKPTIILSVCLLGIYFGLYQNLSVQADHQSTTPFLLSAIGLSFGLFQVLLNISVQGARNKAQLRYNEYKEMAKIMNNISEVLNEGINTPGDVKILSLQLATRTNEFKGFVTNSSYLLFKDLSKKPALIEVKAILNSILDETFIYRKNFFQLGDELQNNIISEGDKEEASARFLHSIWVTNIKANFNKYGKLKYDVLKEMQDYLHI